LRGDKIFYRKSILVCRDQIWNHLSVEYPAARKVEFDAIVARAAQSLRFSGLSEQIPNCR
jgi:serine/threonine-protein kinase